MLVLSRKNGEAIRIDDQVTVKIVGISGNRVRIGICGPDHVSIVREELLTFTAESETQSPIRRSKAGRIAAR